MMWYSCTKKRVERFYSVLHDNDQLFAAKYKTYMPTDEELRAEIESQKNIYYLQKGQKWHWF